MVELQNFYSSCFTVDNIIFGFENGDIKVLLIKRGEEPYMSQWALPGYFVNENESLRGAARRVLKQLTSIENVFLEQIGAFGEIDRHPSGRVVTVAYYSLIKIADYQVTASSIARKASWFKLDEIENLAFDHRKILDKALNQLRWSVRINPVGFELLPPKFTLTDIQKLYETILDIKLDKRNFRKKILSTGLLESLGESQIGVAHRPALLYRFNEEAYNELSDKDFLLAI